MCPQRWKWSGPLHWIKWRTWKAVQEPCHRLFQWLYLQLCLFCRPNERLSLFGPSKCSSWSFDWPSGPLTPNISQMEDGNEEGLHTFLGWVVAAQPLAQFVFSPLMGYLGNRFGTIRYLSMFTMALLAVGFVFYACIHAFPPPRKYYIVAARLIVGAAAGESLTSSQSSDWRFSCHVTWAHRK